MWLFVFYIINLVAINQANLCETVDFDNKMKWMDSKFKGKGTKIMIYAYPRSKGVLWSKAGTNVWGDKAAKQVAAFTRVGTGDPNKHAEVLLLKNKHIVQSRQSRDDKKKSLVFIASKTPCKTCSNENYLVKLCKGFGHCFYFYRKLYKDQNKVYSTPVNWKNKLPLPRWTIVQCSSGNRPNKLTLQQLADKTAVIDKELESLMQKYVALRGARDQYNNAHLEYDDLYIPSKKDYDSDLQQESIPTFKVISGSIFMFIFVIFALCATTIICFIVGLLSYYLSQAKKSCVQSNENIV